MFSDRDKKKALAIVHIFEASKPLGDYSAIGVMDDGAGISYGISQFTHGSGSLAAVLRRFEKLGGVFPPIVAEWYDEFLTRTKINSAASNINLKNALRTLGQNPLMRQAQEQIAFENYLSPALRACEGSNFTLPLSLAVVYDSHNQGGYTRVRDRVQFRPPGNGSITPIEFEKEWITEYCQRRVQFLSGLKSSAARASVYRPKFFLGEIKKGNWQLQLPLIVHGHKLTESVFAAPRPVDDFELEIPVNQPSPVASPPLEPTPIEQQTEQAHISPDSSQNPSGQPANTFETAMSSLDNYGGKIERVDGVVSKVSASSLFGYISKMGMAVGAFGIGFLKDNWEWLVVGAVIVIVAGYLWNESKKRANERTITALKNGH